MFALFSSSSRVNVEVEEVDAYIHPRLEGFPTSDPILRGKAIVSLTAARKIKRIRVVLEGYCDQWGGPGTTYETDIPILQNELKQDLNETFEAGDHLFKFAFVIPSTTAESQRCVFGRTRHSVKAIVDMDGGFVGSSITSPPAPVWIVANSLAPGELPLPTHLAIEHFSEELGPIGFALSSPHLTIAGLCYIRVSLPSPPTAVTILSIAVSIEQSFEIRSQLGKITKPPPQQHQLSVVADGTFPITKREDESAPLAPLPHSRQSSIPSTSPIPLSSVGPSTISPLPTPISSGGTPSRTNLSSKSLSDPSPLCQLAPGSGYTYSKICRLLNDDHLRPSTHEATKSTIRVSHEVVLEIKYRVEGGKEMLIRLLKPFTLISCCCSLDALTLPDYSSSGHLSSTSPGVYLCACLRSTEELLRRDRKGLQAAAASVSPSSTAEPVNEMDDERANKTPAWTEGGAPLAPRRSKSDS